MRPTYTVRRYRDGDAAQVKLRPDMDAEFTRQGQAVPPGPKWTLECNGEVVGVGGLEPSGAATSEGWFLSSDLDPRGWAAARRAVDQAVAWARLRAIRRIHALADGGRPGAAGLLERIGFERTGMDGDDVVLTLEVA